VSAAEGVKVVALWIGEQRQQLRCRVLLLPAAAAPAEAQMKLYRACWQLDILGDSGSPSVLLQQQLPLEPKQVLAGCS
jgi:hypothetical protein